MHYRLADVPRFISTTTLQYKRRSFALDPGEAQHAVKVLRLKEGDVVELCDGEGNVMKAAVDSIDRRAKHCLVTSIEEPVLYSKPKPEIVVGVACGMLKASRGDWMIEKATELGAAQFTPILCERSPIMIDHSRIERWKRVMISAMKQCLRPYRMRIEEPIHLLDFTETLLSPDTISFLADIDGDHLWNAISSCQDVIAKVVVVIGPEGDFTEDEKRTFTAAGGCRVSLGANRLRVETAAIAALSLLHISSLSTPQR